MSFPGRAGIAKFEAGGGWAAGGNAAEGRGLQTLHSLLIGGDAGLTEEVRRKKFF